MTSLPPTSVETTASEMGTSQLPPAIPVETLPGMTTTTDSLGASSTSVTPETEVTVLPTFETATTSALSSATPSESKVNGDVAESEDSKGSTLVSNNTATEDVNSKAGPASSSSTSVPPSALVSAVPASAAEEKKVESVIQHDAPAGTRVDTKGKGIVSVASTPGGGKERVKKKKPFKRFWLSCFGGSGFDEADEGKNKGKGKAANGSGKALEMKERPAAGAAKGSNPTKVSSPGPTAGDGAVPTDVTVPTGAPEAGKQDAAVGSSSTTTEEVLAVGAAGTAAVLLLPNTRSRRRRSGKKPQAQSGTAGIITSLPQAGDDEDEEDSEEESETSGEVSEEEEGEESEDEEAKLILKGGVGVPIGEDGVLRPLLPLITNELKGRKCLVLDLDETLVHSSFKPMNHQADYVIPVQIENQYHNVYVLKRPGVDGFLKAMGEIYEVVVYTASLSLYADPVLDQLDIHRVVSHRLFRESCYSNKGVFVKDLSQLGRPRSECIIIDNSPACCIFQPTNAVPISSWYNDPHDTELTDLIPFLTDLSQVEDVRSVLDSGLYKDMLVLPEMPDLS